MLYYFYNLKSIYLSLSINFRYFLSIIILPFAYIISIFVTKNNNKQKIFLSFIKYTSQEKKQKYKNNYQVIESIKEAGYNFKFINIDIDNKVYSKYFYNISIFIKILKINPKFIYFFSDVQPIGTYPNIIVFYLISKLLKCKTICISHDYVWKINYKYMQFHQKLFSTVLAQPYAYFKNQKKIKFAEPWFATKDLVIKSKKQRDIDLIFVGRKSSDKNREIYLNKLIKDGFKIKVFGPGFQKMLSTKEYKKFYSNTKIALSFTSRDKNPNLQFANSSRGRTLEALSFGCFLLEEKNWVTKLLFKRGLHYDEFKNYNDLKLKINYYLSRYNTKGKKIASDGQNFFLQKYSPKIMWKKIFDRI